jgi:asparagine synthase (glutamine-hydrolysing)
MCGFLGSITFSEISEHSLNACNKRIECRGPDEKNIVVNQKYNSNNLFHNFAFNRLAIIDLTPSASQPMYSKNLNSLVMFNGEIYNHKELRADLEKKKIPFKSSHSDTETLLNGLSVYGINFLNKVNGQFSIFFYNITNNEYYLVRDRAGQKPLYFSMDSKGFYFGSDLISVRNLSNSYKLNDQQIFNFLNLGTTVTPDTFYQNIHSVSPGEFIKLSPEKGNFNLAKRKYWNLSSYIDDKKFDSNEFIDLFEDSVSKRLESDVPVSSFLSGGLDSTAVIKAMKKSRHEINTFSMITESPEYNESEFMEQVVRKYDTNHTYKIINPSITFEEVKSIIIKFDDIIYDPSVIPTYILSERISNEFKVAISGDGGDELLSGYQHYENYNSSKKYSKKLINFLYKIYPNNYGSGNNILKNSDDWKLAFASYYEDEKLMRLLKIKNYRNFKDTYLTHKENDWKSLMITDFDYFLNEMMLKKIDRSSMLNSLEIRSPFLDYRLFEYVAGHSSSNNGGKFSSKSVIKKYLSNDFDDSFLIRPKMGFSINIKEIISSNINEIYETIESSVLKNYLDIADVKKLGLINSRMNALRIWKIYSLSLFLENNKVD